MVAKFNSSTQLTKTFDVPTVSLLDPDSFMVTDRTLGDFSLGVPGTQSSTTGVTYYGDYSPDSVDVVANIDNVNIFMDGGGFDRIMLLGGSNVAQVSDGLGLITCGTGKNQVMMGDDRADTWTMVANFHGGDSVAALFAGSDLTQADFKQLPGVGTGGLTFEWHSTANGVDEKLSFAGYSQSDIGTRLTLLVGPDGVGFKAV